MKEVVRPDYISFYEPTVEYYIKDPIHYMSKREQLKFKAKKEKEKSRIVNDSESLLTVSDHGSTSNLNKSQSRT